MNEIIMTKKESKKKVKKLKRNTGNSSKTLSNEEMKKKIDELIGLLFDPPKTK